MIGTLNLILKEFWMADIYYEKSLKWFWEDKIVCETICSSVNLKKTYFFVGQNLRTEKFPGFVDALHVTIK